MSHDNVCVICEGKKIFLGNSCTFCQCIIWGREFCPVCGKKCHHDSSQTPKQRIVPGYGGLTSTINVTSGTEFTDTTSDNEPIQEFITV